MIRQWLAGLILALLPLAGLRGQVNLPTYGHRDTTCSHIFVYDDGGPLGNHSGSCNGTYTFHTNNPADQWQVTVHSNVPLAPSYVTNFRVIDGDENATPLLYANQTTFLGTPSANTPYAYNYLVQSTGNTVTISLSADVESPSAGFEVELCEIGCYGDRATNIEALMLDTNADQTGGTARLQWQGSAAQWMIIIYWGNPAVDWGNGWGGLVTEGGLCDTFYTTDNFYDFPGYLFGQIASYIIKPDCPAECGGYGVADDFSHSFRPDCECAQPDAATYHFEGDTLVLVIPPADTVTNWYVYIHSFGIDTLLLTGELHLYWPFGSRCDQLTAFVSSCPFTDGLPCNVYVWMIHGCKVPTNFSHELLADSVRFTWTPQPDVSAWGFRYDDWDTLLDGQVGSITVSLPASDRCSSHMAYLSGNCDFAQCEIANMRYSTIMVSRPVCQGIAEGPFLSRATGHSVTLCWVDGAVSPCVSHYIVECVRADNPGVALQSAEVPRGVRQCTFSDLEEATAYHFTVRARCCDGYLSCNTDTATFATTIDGCIDYVNFTDRGHVHLTQGTYQQPYRDTSFFHHVGGVTSPSYFAGSGSHAVMLDTLGRDPLSGGQLRLVPPGQKASIRLGNTEVGARAESISYDHEVDSAVNDLLVLRYAIVMQNPGHTTENQPHFSLEILDAQGRLIDSTCAYADFYAADNLEGFHYEANNVMWLDWTTIGINIAPYHGQRIRVRLTNKDCAEGGHWSYAYFTLACDKRSLCIFNQCDATGSVHLRAPEGFEYRWTRAGDTTVVSRARDLLAPIDSTVLWLCRCSFVGNPGCYYDLEAYAVGITPHARLSYWVDTCRQKIHLVDESYLEVTSQRPGQLGQEMESYWLLPDGSRRHADTLHLDLTHNGLYSLWLVAPLAPGDCADSMPFTLPVDFYHPHSVTGDTIVCHGGLANLAAHVEVDDSVTYTWSTGHKGDTTIVRHPGFETDSLLWVAYAYDLCLDTMPITVHFLRYIDDTLRVDACPGFRFDSLGFHESETGLYTFHHFSQHGCDSLFTLDLMIHPAYDDTLRVATCDQPWGGHSESGFYTERLTTQAGCDSVRHLLLDRRRVQLWGDTVACEGDLVTLSATDLTGEGAFYFWQAGGYSPSVTLPAETRRVPYLLDIYVNDTCSYHLAHPLVVHPLYDDTLVVDYCHDLFDSLGFLAQDDGVYTLRLQSVHGCDSLSTLSLTFRPNYYDTLVVRTCDEPFRDAEWDVEQSGFYNHAYRTVYQCDSILSLDFTRWGVFGDTLVEQIYQFDTFVGHGFHAWEEGLYEVAYTDSHGCDSLYRLELEVLYFQFPNAITPNGDGVNDRFVVHDLLRAWSFDHNELWIYDRNGRLVFHGKDIRTFEECWDPNATHSPTGTYFYRFKARSLNHAHEHKGVIEVLR